MNKKNMLLAMSFIISLTLWAQVPDPGFKIDEHTAFVITDPQNDFLSEKGIGWEAFGPNVKENNTVENLKKIFEIAAKKKFLVFISPHYYYPYDHKWNFEAAGEKFMHSTGMFDKKSIMGEEGFEGSGADWLKLYKPYIKGDNVVVSAPHKIFGPENNDLILQLRKKGINKIILAGMSGNLCVDSHLRELVERGFEVAVVYDATASARLPKIDGPTAAYTNFRLISSHVFQTEELLKVLK